MEKLKDYELEVLDIVKTKDWDRAKNSDKNLYQYVYRHRDTDENCKTIWEHIKTETRDLKSEILEIIETKDWNRARGSNDGGLYLYIYKHKGTDKNCRIIWEHIKTETRDYESKILEIIETKDWDRAKKSNDKNLYQYIRYHHKDDDKNCKILWEHIRLRDLESEVLDIIETKDWDRARWSNNKNLYQYIKYRKDTDENCKIIWEHITIKRHCSYTIKDYLQYYFEQGKPKNHNNTLYQWLTREINKGNQSCIDIKNLIIAAENYQDTIAIETLDLIKNYLEKEGT